MTDPVGTGTAPRPARPGRLMRDRQGPRPVPNIELFFDLVYVVRGRRGARRSGRRAGPI